MELLEDLDMLPIKVRTFTKEINVPVETEYSSDDEAPTQAIDDEAPINMFSSTLNMKVGIGTKERNQAHDSPDLPNTLCLPAILSKVQRRLNGESESAETSVTQLRQIKESEFMETQLTSQSVELSSAAPKVDIKAGDKRLHLIPSQLVETQPVDTDTQTIETQREHKQRQSFRIMTSKLKEINTSDELNTKVDIIPTAQDVQFDSDKECEPQRKGKSNLFLDESESEDDSPMLKDNNIASPLSLSKEKEYAEKLYREQRITALAQKKRNERLLKEQNQNQQEGKDLSNKAQDEESEEEEQEAIDEYRDERDSKIEIEARTIKRFDNKSLFAAFGMPVSQSSSQAKQEPTSIKMEDSYIEDSRESDISEVESIVIERGKKAADACAPFSLKESGNKPDVVILEDSDSDGDELYKHSKAADLEIKAKFSKKRAAKETVKKGNPAYISKAQLFNQLLNANRKQIQEERRLDPKAERRIEEVKREALDVQALLQRHIEHDNRLREKEERDAKISQVNYSDESDADYEEGEVPDSDTEMYSHEEAENVDDDDDGDGDNDKEGEEDISNQEDYSKPAITLKKSRRMAVRDDEEDNDDLEERSTALKVGNNALRLSQLGDDIDLGDFGGNMSQDQNPVKAVSLTQLFTKGSQKKNPIRPAQPHEFFDQLRQKANSVHERLGHEGYTDGLAHSVRKQTSVSPNAQENSKEGFPSAAQTSNSENEDDKHVSRPKRLTKRKAYSSDEGSDSDIEDTEEQKLERIRLAELMKKQRREELNIQKRKKQEMRARGLDKMMEAEAEESEDEWFGVGGADGERSDEENSEDEALFDDISKVKVNKAAIEAKLREETNATEKALLERILKDLEAGKLGKRGKDSDFDLDIDAGEDEVMRSYRIYNQMMKRQQLDEDEALRKLAKDKRSKAFFDSITEDVYDSRKDIFGGSESEEQTESEGEDNPFQIKDNKGKEFKDPNSLKKKKKITVAFVQKTLSFITNPDEGDNQESFKRRYSVGEDDYSEDLYTLKQNSIVKMAEKTPIRKNKSAIDLTDEGDLSPTNLFKAPSLISRSSFQSFERPTSNEVTVSTITKTTSSAKASVMSFGKRMIDSKKTDLKEKRVLKVRKIASKVSSHSNRLKNLNNAQHGFE